MKKRSLIIILFAILLVFSGAAVIACGTSEERGGGSHTVTFVGASYAAVTVKDGAYVDLPTPTRSGYTFAGWFTDSTFSDRYYGYEPVKSDLTLYAYWQDGATVQYTIRFYNNSQEVAVRVIDAGGTLKYSQFPILTQRDGYVSYWQCNNDIINSDIIGVDRNMDINAVYEFESAVKTVTFNSMGGSDVSPQIVNINEKAKYPVEPHKDGMYFVGWFTNESCTAEYDFNSSVLNNITLYAGWSATEPAAANGTVVTFEIPKIIGDFNGWDYSVSQKYSVASGRIGVYFNPLCDSRVLIVYSKIYADGSWTFNEAYNFSGESAHSDLSNASRLEKNGSTDDYYIASIRTYDKKFGLSRYFGGSLSQGYDADSGILQLRDVHRVRFDTAGGSSVSAQYISDGDKAVVPEEPTYLGKIFGGWTNGSGAAVNVAAQTITSNIVFYAKWEDAYLVTFDTQGGTAVDRQTVAKNSPYIKEPAYPSRNGHYFDGWYTEIELENKFDFSTGISSDVTLYAKWNIIDVNTTSAVTFDYQGGTVNAAQSQSVEVASGRTISPLLYSPRKSGQYLTGWYRDKACNVVFDFDEIIYSDTTLYAGYATIPSGYYVVYFDCSPRLPKLTQVGKNPYGYAITGDNYSTVLRDGYSFTGWYTDSACTVHAQTWTQGSSGQVVTMYAGWERAETRNFTYYNYDGTVFKVEQHRLNTIMTYNQLAKPNARSGYDFIGWYTDKSLTKKFSDSMKVTDDVDLYPKWEQGIGTRVIYYNMDGTELGRAITYEGTRTKAELLESVNSTKSGYVFNQWFLDSERTYPLPDSYLVEGDVSLYGSWIADKSSEVKGGGTSSSPYLVSNYDQFASHLIKTGNEIGKYYKFTANVAFGASGNEQLTDLYATVDFDGHSVTGVTRPMFENIMKGAQFTGAKITANITKINGRTSYVGIVCCYCSGFIGQVWTLGAVNLPSIIYVGGIAGGMSGNDTKNYTIIENCLNSANITARDYAGGIAGSHSARGQIMRYCVNEGTMSAALGTYNQNQGKYYKHASGVVGNTTYPYRIIGCVTTTEGVHEALPYESGQVALAGHTNGQLMCVNGLPNTLNGTYLVDKNSTSDILSNWLNYKRNGTDNKFLTYKNGSGGTSYCDDPGDVGGKDFFSDNDGTWYSDGGKFRLEFFRGK